MRPLGTSSSEGHVNTPKTSTSGPPPLERGQVLTHNIGTNFTRGGTTRLRLAPAEKDHPADSDHPDQWEQAPHPAATPPSVPPASAPPTTTSSPHLRTVTSPRRRSGAQS